MPPTDALQLADYRIKVNGVSLPQKARDDIIALAVSEERDLPGMFSLRLHNWDPEHQRVTWADDDLFREGSEVSIQMGYRDKLDTLMQGEITGLELVFVAGDPFTVTVRGFDRLHRLLRGRHTRSFTAMSDSMIARNIASEAGLSASVQDSKVTHDYVLQHNQTNLAFLQDRARRIGYELAIEDKKLHFQPSQHNKPSAVTLSPSEDIIEFYPRLSTLTQVGQVEVRGWDPAQKEALSAQAGVGKEISLMAGKTSGPQAANSAFGKSSSAAVSQPVFNLAEADQIAAGRFNDMALAYIGGEGLCHGRTALRAGKVVELTGLGKRFSGLYYVTATVHSILPGQGYRTRFWVQRNAT